MIESIYHRALEQHPEFRKIPKEEIIGIINNGLNEIQRLENAANSQNAKIALTKDVAQNITVLWDFSGPGVYDGNDRQDDRYTELPWARTMERERLNYTATLARRIAELLQQEIPAKDSISDTKKNILKVKNMISQSGPMIVYNGTLSENERIRDILQREDIIIPQEKVLVLDNEYTHNTNDQIKTMNIPEELHKAGKEIGLISSAPHLWRVIHVLNQYKTLPEDMKVRLFPVATPYDGKEEYAVMEIMGLLYYAYITKSAKLEAYPHIIHGDQENTISS